MWDVFNNPDGDYGWTGPTYVYNDSITGYSEDELKNIIAQIVACETSDGFGCGLSDADLMAAKEYTLTYYSGNEILCTTYLKTNLIYDLQTNTEGVTGFTDVVFHDWRAYEDPNWNGKYLFDQRYWDLQWYTSDAYPGLNTNPIMVDIMFQIVSINERKSFW